VARFKKIQKIGTVAS